MRKVDDSEFVEFVAQRGGALLRHAHVLCGNPTQAEDLVQESLARLYVRWGAVVEDNPEPYARRMITTSVTASLTPPT